LQKGRIHIRKKVENNKKGGCDQTKKENKEKAQEAL
jgi:hypothetical protein